ncbi:GNAT family N-acetyltransferase [Jeotgalibacillus terrae]|uniref:GNAT family N-acetyltransferase n=1 Tax=Jeotgalibacillus terrae TaxID=587735 RepID=A0ABW5ZE59_9BACL|nr:GNAT family protein [Jeotgalibacillus terrae]MBM7579172.1 ribosomal-protein-alanine N-acetyltransferase [Jeotgalibacillus terrae]
MNPFDEFETERLALVALTKEHTQFIFDHFSDPVVCRFLLDEEVYTEMEEAENFILYNAYHPKKNHNRWAITLKDSGDMIGTCGFHQWDRYNNIAEIGYDLTPDQWGKGYGREAVTGMIEHGFQYMKLNRIEAYAAKGNSASMRLLEKLGFKQEGLVRDKHLFQGKYYDHYSYSILKREWENGS